MRPRFKPPLNKRYFHTKRKIDNKDMALINKRLVKIRQRKIKNQHKEKIKEFNP
jgi:hypothetical protein